SLDVVGPIYTDVLPMIYPLLKEAAEYVKDPLHPHVVQAQAVRDTLDRMNIWNKVVYLGVMPKDANEFSPFRFGSENNLSHHWANLVAEKDRNNGFVRLMIIDMVISPKEPQPLQNWFNGLVAGDSMFDSEYKQSSLYIGIEWLPDPRIPTEKDLHLVINDRFYPNKNNWQFDCPSN
ncbi:MAG: hypothetical protein ACREGC_04105, partial [Minisyncoccia bacterium]